MFRKQQCLLANGQALSHIIILREVEYEYSQKTSPSAIDFVLECLPFLKRKKRQNNSISCGLHSVSVECALYKSGFSCRLSWYFKTFSPLSRLQHLKRNKQLTRSKRIQEKLRFTCALLQQQM